MKPRNRIVNFRLTEAEYNQLKTACTAHGSRCVSEFARTAVMELARSKDLHDGAVPGRLIRMLIRMDDRLTSLGSGIHRLIQLLEPEELDGPPTSVRDAIQPVVLKSGDPYFP